MIIRIVMKSPDAVSYAVEAAVHEELQSSVGKPVDADEIRETISSTLSSIERWVKYGEYVTIEIDTDQGTAVVVPQY